VREPYTASARQWTILIRRLNRPAATLALERILDRVTAVIAREHRQPAVYVVLRFLY
jgi:hypothetical protein